MFKPHFRNQKMEHPEHLIHVPLVIMDLNRYETVTWSSPVRTGCPDSSYCPLHWHDWWRWLWIVGTSISVDEAQLQVDPWWSMVNHHQHYCSWWFQKYLWYAYPVEMKTWSNLISFLKWVCSETTTCWWDGFFVVEDSLLIFTCKCWQGITMRKWLSPSTMLIADWRVCWNTLGFAHIVWIWVCTGELRLFLAMSRRSKRRAINHPIFS